MASATKRTWKTIDPSLQLKVEALDWERKDADTRQLTHGIHRYSGKFIPQIARQAIELLTDAEDLLLDPYCGSGTTLLESYVSGRRSIGIDLNPLAVLVARTKCTPIARKRLDELRDVMKREVAEIREDDSQGPLFSQVFASPTQEAIRADPRFRDVWRLKWFDESSLYQLIGIHRAVASVGDAELRNVALAAFSDILRRCSHAHGGYPNVMYDKRRRRRPQPAPLFLARLEEICDAVERLAHCPTRVHRPEVRDGDARNTGLPADSVDAVVTHPPYIGSIPYAEYGLLSLTWLGHDAKDLDRRLTGGRRQSPDVLERFEMDYGRMLVESCRVLKPQKYLFVQVGHPVVRGKRVDLTAMTIDLAQRAGLSLAAQTSRKGVNRRANKMAEEDLLFFRKSGA